MDNPLVIVLLTVAAVVALWFIFVFLMSGGNFHRIGLELRSSVRVLRDPEYAAKVEALLAPPPPKDLTPPKPSGVPLRILALMQREGRLIDFLMEDLQNAEPGQIVDGVRTIHPKWQHVLKEHLVLEPVIAQPEGSTVEVPPGFDPSAVRLIGNVTGQPPFRGNLVHSGWRVKEIKLAPPPEGQDELVLQPAEVELP